MSDAVFYLPDHLNRKNTRVYHVSAAIRCLRAVAAATAAARRVVPPAWSTGLQCGPGLRSARIYPVRRDSLIARLRVPAGHGVTANVAHNYGTAAT